MATEGKLCLALLESAMNNTIMTLTMAIDMQIYTINVVVCSRQGSPFTPMASTQDGIVSKAGAIKLMNAETYCHSLNCFECMVRHAVGLGS